MAHATTISNGTFTVGIGSNGELYNFSTGIGFRRLSDGFDPIAPGSPRDSWGIAINGLSAYADQAYFGTFGVSSTSTFGPSSGTVTSSILSGAATERQSYHFVAPNVLAITTTVTNTTGAAANVLYQRNVDFDVAPTAFSEVTKVPAVPAGSRVSNDTYYGFNSPVPTTPYMLSAFPAGGTFGPSDLGGGIELNLGTLANGASTTFTYFYADNNSGQSPSALDAELAGLGAGFVVTSYSADGNFNTATNSAAIGVGVPEPASLTLLAGGVAALGLVRRRKAQAA
jgi:hypothetical protein